MATTRMIRTACAHCGSRFEQPDDPGRKRRFCSAACKQAAYRARKRREQEARRRAEEEAARRAREDQAAHDRARRRYEGLCAKAASTGFPEEAAACRAKAEQLRAKYGL